MNKIIPTPRDKHPDPKLRGDRISGERYYSKEFMQKEWDHIDHKVLIQSHQVKLLSQLCSFS